MLRTLAATRTLGVHDQEAVLRLCERDPAANVFVAARVVEGGLAQGGPSWGTDDAQGLRSLCWGAANVVPIGCDENDLDLFAARLRRHRRRVSSLFGAADQVLPLWERLARHWGTPMSVRPDQPMMTVSTPPSAEGRPLDPRVRPARPDEVDLVLPASVAMFTEEIGYPPYTGSSADYRRYIAGLVRAGRTWVVVEDGQVAFKADVGSLALGVAQIQGVWVAPRFRGRGWATPAMNAVVEQVLATVAPVASLYVNGYNEPALRAYRAGGFRQVGTFATVIL